MPLVSPLSGATREAAAGIPAVISKDMTQPPFPPPTAPQLLLTLTKYQSFCGTEPVLKNSVAGEHSPSPLANAIVAASGAGFITPDALNPILYSVGLRAAFFPQ